LHGALRETPIAVVMMIMMMMMMMLVAIITTTIIIITIITHWILLITDRTYHTKTTSQNVYRGCDSILIAYTLTSLRQKQKVRATCMTDELNLTQVLFQTPNFSSAMER
jgi:hypothetical protein